MTTTDTSHLSPIPAHLIVERPDIQSAIEHAHALFVAAHQPPVSHVEYWNDLAAGVLGAALWLANQHNRHEVLDWLIDIRTAQDAAATWIELDGTDPCVTNARQRLTPYLTGQHEFQDVLTAMFRPVLFPESITR